MPEETLAALPVVGAAERGREGDGFGAGGRVGAAIELALAVGSTEAANGEGEVEAVGAARVPDEAAGDEVPVGRNFLLARSTEPDDCQERLWDGVAPEAGGSGLEGEAYF